MFHKIFIICFLLIFISLYLYVVRESFTNDNQTAISTKLISEISRVLGISSRRITNIEYTGDITKNALQVSFVILEPNLVEYTNKEMNATDAATQSIALMSSNSFTVNIDGYSVSLSSYNTSTDTVPIVNYFNNNGLKDIAEYSYDKYVSVPNDASLTYFYKLNIDSNYNIKPVL
jgi:hypothetical protein